MAWCQNKTNYLEEPITLSSLEVVKQKAHEFSVIKQFIYCCALNIKFKICSNALTGCCKIKQTTEQTSS